MQVGNDVVDLSDPETLRQALHPRFDERVFTRAEAAIIGSSAHSHRLRWAYWAAKESAYKVAKKLDRTTIFSPVRFAVTLDRNHCGVVFHDDKRFTVRIKHTRRCVHAIAFYTPNDSSAPGFYVPSSRDCGLPSKRFSNAETVRITHRSSGASLAFRYHGASTSLANTSSNRSVTENRVITHNGPFHWLSGDLSRTDDFFLYGHARANRMIKNHPDEISSFARRQATYALGSLLGIRPDSIEISRDRRVPHARFRGTDLPVDLSLSHHGSYVAYALCYLMATNSTSKTSIP